MTCRRSWRATTTGSDMKGQIRRRGERSWELRFDLGADPGTGRRRLRYASFKGSKRDAEISLARLISENAAGTGIDPSKATLSEFLDRWTGDWAACNVRGKTLERYRDLIALYIKPHLGAVRVQKLRPVQLNELYSKLLRAGGKGRRPLSPGTVGLRPSRAAPCAWPCRDLRCCSSKRRCSRQATQAGSCRNQDLDRRSDPRAPRPSRRAHAPADRLILARHRLPPRRSSGAAMERYRLERLAGAHRAFGRADE